MYICCTDHRHCAAVIVSPRLSFAFAPLWSKQPSNNGQFILVFAPYALRRCYRRVLPGWPFVRDAEATQPRHSLRHWNKYHCADERTCPCLYCIFSLRCRQLRETRRSRYRPTKDALFAVGARGFGRITGSRLKQVPATLWHLGYVAAEIGARQTTTDRRPRTLINILA